MPMTDEDRELMAAAFVAAQQAHLDRQAQGAAAAGGEVAGAGRDRPIAAAERSKHMSFVHDPTLMERAIHPWPNSSVRIPKDIVDLARHGTQIPLIWLTVEGMLEVSARGRKLITIPPTPKVQEQLAAAHEKDRFLPRGAFSQALQALVVLWTAVGPQPIDGGASQASLLEDLHLVILAQAVDEHWPIWRCYAKKVLDWVFEERGPGEGIGVDIAKVNERIVAEAERDCRCPPGRASDFTNTSKTMVAQLLRAEGEEVGRLGAVMDELHMSATFGKASVESESATGQQGLGLGLGAPFYAGPPSGPRADRPPSWIPPAAPRWSGPSHYASAPTQSWQRRDFDRGPQPFSRAPLPYPSRDGGAWPSRGPRPDRDYHQQRTPQFCTTCLEIVADHDFRTCRRPHNSKLEQYNGGWRYPGKDLPYCHRFNSLGRLCLRMHVRTLLLGLWRQQVPGQEPPPLRPRPQMNNLSQSQPRSRPCVGPRCKHQPLRSR